MNEVHRSLRYDKTTLRCENEGTSESRSDQLQGRNVTRAIGHTVGSAFRRCA